MQGIRDYLRYIKRGYGRTTHLATIDIRNGRMARDEGLKLVDKYDGKRPESLPHFLEMLALSEDEFNRIAESHTVPPHSSDFNKIKTGSKLPDRDKWDCSACIDRSYTEKKLKEHNFDRLTNQN